MEIKTNDYVGNGTGPRYCNNAQILFDIGGKGFGCVWDGGSGGYCSDLVLKSVSLSASCLNFTKEDCNYNVTKDGKSCFWNDNGLNSGCMSKDVENCASICNNDVSGFNTHFCDGNTVHTSITSELCKWLGEEGSDETHTGCSCEGVEIPENCVDLNISSPSECKKLVSETVLNFKEK
jgi:hypothetical protein